MLIYSFYGLKRTGHGLLFKPMTDNDAQDECVRHQRRHLLTSFNFNPNMDQ